MAKHRVKRGHKKGHKGMKTIGGFKSEGHKKARRKR